MSTLKFNIADKALVDAMVTATPLMRCSMLSTYREACVQAERERVLHAIDEWRMENWESTEPNAMGDTVHVVQSVALLSLIEQLRSEP